ncbi:hypothetical protein, partial [Shewanella algae]|uniref:hypothetical protein n=1 Tax=Shewanella algae TaxID=38313 RepID=UPI00313CF770
KRGKTEQESINNAIEHSRMFSHAVQDRFSVGLYFIADEAELGVDHSAEGNVVPMANLHKILSQGAIEIDYFSESGQALKDPRVRKISGKELL